jgi:hypothetical protein
MIDPQTMTIISAVGAAGAGVAGALWRSVVKLHTTTVDSLNEQNRKLEKRTEDCEEDRKLLHGRINEQGDRLTEISQQLGRLEGRFEKPE